MRTRGATVVALIAGITCCVPPAPSGAADPSDEGEGEGEGEGEPICNVVPPNENPCTAELSCNEAKRYGFVWAGARIALSIGCQTDEDCMAVPAGTAVRGGDRELEFFHCPDAILVRNQCAFRNTAAILSASLDNYCIVGECAPEPPTDCGPNSEVASCRDGICSPYP